MEMEFARAGVDLEIYVAGDLIVGVFISVFVTRDYGFEITDLRAAKNDVESSRMN